MAPKSWNKKSTRLKVYFWAFNSLASLGRRGNKLGNTETAQGGVGGRSWRQGNVKSDLVRWGNHVADHYEPTAWNHPVPKPLLDSSSDLDPGVPTQVLEYEGLARNCN